MKVLIVDGPARGEVREINKGHRFTVAVPGVDHYRQVDYHIHQYQFMDRILLLASVYLIPDQISTDSVFEAIASDKAKDVVSEKRTEWHPE
jgi:hypothetical protein